MTERAIRLRVGGKTDVGRVRDHNEDSMLLGPRIHVVADGMGGHQGGEVASAVAIEMVSRSLEGMQDLTLDDLVLAVREANKAVFRQGMSDRTLTGMGTTLVGLAVVTDEQGPLITIVNVGDSRAYRLSQGEFDQITEDHGPVGQLLREGAITPEEARIHPMRNVVNRALGMDDDISVDDFQILPEAGDRYLLCSDGLTDEVTADEIAEVLRRIDDPDEAANELVRRANDHGGRDNITVVVVDVLDDGGLADEAPAVVPDAEDFSYHADTDTQSYAAATGAVSEAARRRAAADTPGDGSEHGDDEGSDQKLSWRERRAERRRNRPRAITLRSALFVVVVAAVIGGGLFLVDVYATDTYHVTIADDEVTIMKGRPGGFLWYDPTVVETTGIAAEDVPASRIDGLEEGVSQSSLGKARRYVQNLEDQIEAITPPVTTSTTTRVPTSTTRPTTTTSTTGN